MALTEKQENGGNRKLFPMAMIVHISLKTIQTMSFHYCLILAFQKMFLFIVILGNRGNVAASDDDFHKLRVKTSEAIYNLDDPYIKSDRGKIWENIEKVLKNIVLGILVETPASDS